MAKMFQRIQGNLLAVAELSPGGSEYLDLATDFKLLELVSPLAGNCYFFNRLNVPESLRGQGIATELLKETIDWAREEGVLIINTVNAYGNMSHRDLMNFYTNHGFKVLEPEGLLVYHRDVEDYTPARKLKV